MNSQEQSLTIDIESVSTALREPLALVSDPERRQQVEAFAGIARPGQERALTDLLSRVVGYVNEHSDTRFRLEHEAGGLHLRAVEEAPDGGTGWPGGDGALDKVTIRLPGELKQAIEQLANGRGMSLNTWYVWALSRVAARQGMRGGGHPAHHRPERARGRGGRERGFRRPSRPDADSAD